MNKIMKNSNDESKRTRSNPRITGTEFVPRWNRIEGKRERKREYRVAIMHRERMNGGRQAGASARATI